MQISISLGTCTLKQLRDVIDWLEKSPLELNPASLEALSEKSNARIKISARSIIEPKPSSKKA